jgi:beta-glucosidase
VAARAVSSRRRATFVLAAAAALALLAPFAAAAQRPNGPCPGPTLRTSGAPPAATPWKDASLSADARADLLLRAMTLEEKADLATGERCLWYGYYNAPIDRLGIPALTMADGPAGIRIPYERVNGGRATQLPSPIALAASWDPALAAAQGDLLGAEALATGHNVLLGPTLDLARTPLAGRLFEGFGEDPLLSARLAVPLVRGIQQHPVLADAKHFAAYAQETERFTVDARVDERALRELWLRPFEAAVREGEVATVMCGFNRVNGVFACEDRTLLTDVLKGEMGFQGFVLSDWGSIHGTLVAANAGLDQELAFETFFGRRLRDAVVRGELPVSVVDDKARRILRSMFRVGLFDRRVAEEALPEQEHGARSRELAEQGVVLLKNAGGLLPLASGKVSSIAVIGADATNVSAQGGGAARVEPTYAVSPLDGIRGRAGAGVRVEHAAGGDPVTAAHLLPGPPPLPSAVLSPPEDPAAHGLRGEYWLNARFEGAPDYTRLDRQPAASLGFFAYQSVNASSVEQVPSYFALEQISARWTGTLVAPATGDFTLVLTSRGQGWVWLDGALVLDHSGSHDLASRSATVHLVAGERHDLKVDYAADWTAIGKAIDLGGDVKLGWIPPAGAVEPAIRDAAALAAASDVAVVVARDYSSEERDHPGLSLPGEQDDLVRAVGAANPRTVVVLTTGGPTAMPWLDAVPSVVQAWYPGQEQGNVIARVLFGDVNPSGKLPVTFPRAIDQTPSGPITLGPPDDVGPTSTFSEGLLAGYRWYDAKGVEPLFPFGHGLSYSTFAYDRLEVTGGAGGPRSVSFTITNTRGPAGAEVAQVYVGPCASDSSAPPRQLAGFAKVRLEPGASQRVTVDLAPEPLAAWSPATRAWTTAACARNVWVGGSSRDLPLTTDASGPPVVQGAGPQIGPEVGAGGGGGGCASAGGTGALSLLALALLLKRARRAS